MVIKTKGLKKFTTLDYVYIGIGGALTAAADHLIGDAIFLPSGIYPWINPPVFFRIIVAFVIVGIVRKFGAGMMTMGVFDIVGDLIHFSFSGEPLWFFEDVLTYGLMADIAILLTKGKLFMAGNGIMKIAPLLEGAVLGFFWSFPHPFFTYGFIAPLLYGFVPNQARVMYLFVSYAVGNTIIGAFAGGLSNRVIKIIS